MDSIVTKRLFVGALIIAFIGACGSTESTDSPPNDGGSKPVCASDAECEKDEPVCNKILGECVGCVGDADCGEESLCLENSCVLRCDSDNDCQTGALRCNAGHCVECTEHDDCPDENNCHSGRCLPWTCTPGSVRCSGTEVTVCDATGLDYSATTDCGVQGGTCEAGTCVGVACDAGAFLCDGAVLYQCAASGTSLTSVEVCDTAELCNAVEGSCSSQVCTPGDTVCDGTVLRVCNADGSALEVSADCSDNDEVCYEGACLRCTPNSVGCVDNARALCEADGSEYVLGPACDADEICVSGSCLPVICDADTLYCEGQVLYRCASDGTTNSVDTTCETDSFCTAGENTCQPDICEAGEPACDGETLATCADDGGGYTDGTTNCAASDQVCDLAACVTAAEDTLGAAVSSVRLNSALAANRYYVSHDRILTEIQQYSSISGTAQFTWAVYEESTHENYTNIFESQNLSSELSFHSSGTISVPLLAGRSYMIGVHVVGVANAGLAPPIEVFASFGRVTGATVLEAESTLPSSWLVQDDSLLDSIFYQTLTTELP